MSNTRLIETILQTLHCVFENRPYKMASDDFYKLNMVTPLFKHDKLER